MGSGRSWIGYRGLAVVVSLVAGCHGSGPSAKSGAPLATAPAARFVKFEEVTEWSGKPWGAIAEFNLLDATGAVVDRSHWSASADSSGAVEPPGAAIDGNPASHWHSQWETDPTPPPPHALVVNLGRIVHVSGFRYLPRQDNVVNGTFAKYRLYLSDDGTHWGDPVAEGDFTTQGAPTAEKTVVFATQTANHPPTVTVPTDQTVAMGQPVALQLAATDVDGDVLVYHATGLPRGIELDAATGAFHGTPIEPGAFDVKVEVSDGKGPATVAFRWTIGPPEALKGASPLAPGQVRFVKLEALSEINGKEWSSIADFNLVDDAGHNLSRQGWRAAADSAGFTDPPGNAIDDSPRSLWHTEWQAASPPPPPHVFLVDLGQGMNVRGFRYLPRQDGVVNGTIGRFRFYTSVDGLDWGKPVAEGDFATLGPAGAEKTVMLR
jgi:hypothetical protein